MTSLVFVHGLMGGSQQWAQQLEALSDFDSVALDLPGFGKNADAKALTSISDFAVWALDELSSRGVQRFNLIGHSMGGMVAQEMIARAPERVDRLVLYGTGATGVLPGRFETIATSKDQAPPPDGLQQRGFCTKIRQPPMKIARKSRSLAELRQFLPG